jgi:hypothetical protein
MRVKELMRNARREVRDEKIEKTWKWEFVAAT